MKIIHVVGTRPNFMKLAPIIRACNKYNVNYKIVHTGQHYDDNMSDIFFDELEIEKPHYNLNIGSFSHADQTAQIMQHFDVICKLEEPDIVLVVGDVNSTLACSLVVSKLDKIKLAHVEAGLRSFDRTMPEEVNRVVTDTISDYLFCTNQESADNLYRNKDVVGKVHVVGDVMIDTLLYHINKIDIENDLESYVLVTIHRPSNTNNKDNLGEILMALDEISKTIKVVFPIHPRTNKKIEEFNLEKHLKNIEIWPAFGYMKFLKYMKNACVVITDSGSIQVETTVLNKYCITIRENTEREFTLTEGTNILVPANADKIYNKTMNYLLSSIPAYSVLDEERRALYDGKAAERIIEILAEV